MEVLTIGLLFINWITLTSMYVQPYLAAAEIMSSWETDDKRLKRGAETAEVRR